MKHQLNGQRTLTVVDSGMAPADSGMTASQMIVGTKQALEVFKASLSRKPEGKAPEEMALAIVPIGWKPELAKDDPTVLSYRCETDLRRSIEAAIKEAVEQDRHRRTDA